MQLELIIEYIVIGIGFYLWYKYTLIDLYKRKLKGQGKVFLRKLLTWRYKPYNAAKTTL